MGQNWFYSYVQSITLNVRKISFPIKALVSGLVSEKCPVFTV